MGVTTPPEIKRKIHVIRSNLISDYTVTYSTFRNNHICFNFQISFTRNRTTFAGTRYVPMGSVNTPKMHLRPSPGCKRIYYVFTAQETYLVPANVVLFLVNEI